MLSDKALKNVQACLASCDELINGRFIFAENIIAKILSNISDCDELFDLISECMKNFNYDKELNRARIKLPTKNGYFVMPESRAIILPFVFCLLVDIRDGKIAFREFLKNYFMCDETSEFENFSKTVISPFKEAICYCFDLDKSTTFAPEEKEQESETEEETPKERKTISTQEIVDIIESDDKTKKLVDSVKRICNEIISQINSEKKLKVEIKEDALYLVNFLITACNKNDINEINALIVALDYILVNIKPVRFLSKELRQVLAEFYN